MRTASTHRTSSPHGTSSAPLLLKICWGRSVSRSLAVDDRHEVTLGMGRRRRCLPAVGKLPCLPQTRHQHTSSVPTSLLLSSLLRLLNFPHSPLCLPSLSRATPPFSLPFSSFPSAPTLWCADTQTRHQHTSSVPTSLLLSSLLRLLNFPHSPLCLPSPSRATPPFSLPFPSRRFPLPQRCGVQKQRG